MCIENVFAEVSRDWAFVADWRKQQMTTSPVSATYLVAHHLHNLQACLHGNQMSAMCGWTCNMSLEDYMAHANRPAYSGL